MMIGVIARRRSRQSLGLQKKPVVRSKYDLTLRITSPAFDACLSIVSLMSAASLAIAPKSCVRAQTMHPDEPPFLSTSRILL
jgi:hypothetical protein